MDVASTIAGEQDDDPRIAVVIQAILEHAQLQPLIGHALLALVSRATVQPIDLDTAVLHPVPELLHFWGNGSGRHGPPHRPVGMGQAQQVVEMDEYQVPGSRRAVSLVSEALRFVVDVGVVPVKRRRRSWHGLRAALRCMR